jgi:hypothetical protein
MANSNIELTLRHVELGLKLRYLRLELIDVLHTSLPLLNEPSPDLF